MAFLDDDPSPEAKTLSERVRAKRRQMGWTIPEAAAALGVDPATWGEWERGKAVKWSRFRKRIDALLDSAASIRPPSTAKR